MCDEIKEPNEQRAPLASSEERVGAEAADATNPASLTRHDDPSPQTPQPEKEKRHEPFARAANEDDDGYDPWSDRMVSDPFWEEDPWA